MHSQSLPNPYENSGVVIEPGPGAARTRRARSTQLTSKRKKRSKGWIGYVVLLLGMAGFGYFALGKIRKAESKAGALEVQLAAAEARIVAAEGEAMNTSAELMRSEKELAESAASLKAAEEKARAKEEAAAAMSEKLSAVLEDGQGQVLRGADGRLTLQLVDKVLFKSGEAELTAKGKRVMARVGVALQEMEDKQVWVQGHTDDVPIQKNSEVFATNWELSAARALTVVHFLQDSSGVDPKRLAAAAFGSHRPVSKRKKAKNRRIEIVLFPRDVTLRSR